MLVNEIYIGNMVQGKYGSISYKTKQNKPRPKDTWYRVEGTHEAIIDRELWNRVQDLVAERVKPFDTGNVGIFARKVHCASCGYIMRSSKNRGKHYLQCANRHVSGDSCEGAFVPVAELEQIVLNELKRLSAEYLDQDALEQNLELEDNLHGRKERLLAELAAYRKKIEEDSEGIRQLYVDKVKGLISAEDFVELSKKFTEERERMKRLIAEGEGRIERLEEQLQSEDHRKDLIAQYMNLEHLNREMVDVLIDYITVGRRNKETRQVPVEIHWNF